MLHERSQAVRFSGSALEVKCSGLATTVSGCQKLILTEEVELKIHLGTV